MYGGVDHFHVHIVHAAQDGTMGMAVGQAHLLEDVVAMVSRFGLSRSSFLGLIVRCITR